MPAIRTIHRKLLRNLHELKGQAAAIAVVIAAGVVTLMVSVASLDAISHARDRFYRDYGFAHVFADLKRAPENIAIQLREIPGVNLVETRIRAMVRLEVDGFTDPVKGLINSIPDGRQPYLNRLHLREGDLPEPGRFDQVAISEPFAEAHELHAGDRLVAIINGKREMLTVSGVVLSPEFVYQVAPGDIMPDYERYGVLWMNRRALANAFDLDGAFNNVSLTLQSHVDPEDVMDAVDLVLAPYGGIGAYDRELHVSDRFLSEELDQLQVMASVIPAIFLGVAAFLLNVVMGRIISTQQPVIAVLKAFGYRNSEIALHFGLFTGMIVLSGTVLGVAVGIWAASSLVTLYMDYFRFPEFGLQMQGSTILLGASIAAAAALLGTFRVVMTAVRMPPAEAMRPPAPERFRRGWIERVLLDRLIDEPTRIIVRNLGRHRIKAVFSVLGIALATALLVVAGFQFGSIDRMLDTQYRKVMRMNVMVQFNESTSARAVAEIRHVPGVRFVESFRSVPVRLVNGRTDYQTAILGMDAVPKLRRLIDHDGMPAELPQKGLLLTRYLADYLGAVPGDMLQVEILEGRRQTATIALAGTVDEPVGVGAYMERRALNRLMREGPAISGVWVLADRDAESAMYARFADIPRIAGISLVSEVERLFRQYIDDATLMIATTWLLLAGSIAFAVVYNNARITFAERARELATLRVLGFSRLDVGWILVGEIVLLTLLAIPVGWLIGTGFAWLLSAALSMDLYRVPFLVTPRSYALAATGILSASIVSLLVVARRLRHIDMVAALKTIE